MPCLNRQIIDVQLLTYGKISLKLSKGLGNEIVSRMNCGENMWLREEL